MIAQDIRTRLKEAVLARNPALFWKYLRYRYGWGEIEPETQLIESLCDPTGTAIDVGAHYGAYAYYMVQFARRTLLFEPLPSLAAILERYYEKFGSRVQVEQVALSDETGEMMLRTPATNPGRGTIASQNRLTAELAPDVVIKERTVATCRLDDYEIDDLAFLKIDVEGHEEAVLRGSMKTIQKSLPAVLIEVEERHSTGSVDRVLKFMSQFEYGVFFLQGNRLRPIENFSLELNQDDLSPDRYIRNFLFLTAEQRSRCEQALLRVAS